MERNLFLCKKPDFYVEESSDELEFVVSDRSELYKYNYEHEL